LTNLPNWLNVTSPGKSRILTIPDTHFPFVDKKRLGKMIERSGDLGPTHMVQIGDQFDWYNASRFTKSHNIMTPEDEIKRGRDMAEKMWFDLKRKAPKAQCFQLWGNHEERPMKRLMEKAPELESLLKKPLQDILTFPGVTSTKGPLDELVINGIKFHHGWSTQRGFHVNYFQMSVAHGHTHHGDVFYLRREGETLFELDSGILADFNSDPMTYRSSQTCKWTPGFGFIDELGPRFCPL
jgi:hypothetical protein